MGTGEAWVLKAKGTESIGTEKPEHSKVWRMVKHGYGQIWYVKVWAR